MRTRGSSAWGTAEDGALVEVRCSSVETSELAPYWPPTGLALSLESPTREPSASFDVETTPMGWIRTESDLSLFAAEHLSEQVAIHAGIVAWQGRAIIVPGRSMAGKSTLTLALADAGATVLSDEYALVQPRTGLVTGWNRPARRRHPDGSVERIALGAAPVEPMAVSLVASLRFDPELPSRHTPMSPDETASELLANTVGARRHPHRALEAASELARNAAGIRGIRHEAGDAAAMILELADLVISRRIAS